MHKDLCLDAYQGKKLLIDLSRRVRQYVVEHGR